MTRRVLITAGAAGIGRVLARRFVAEGYELALCDNDPAALEDARAEFPKALIREADVTKEEEMILFFDEADALWDRVDVVCAKAGIGGPAGPIETLDHKAVMECIDVNLGGAFLTCRWAAARTKAQGSGLILLTSSTAGLFGYPNRTPYAAAKWGVIGLMKSLAMELGPHGVRVNALCPGAVEGERMERVLAMEAKATGRAVDEVRQSYVKGVSMRSWVTADDVADTALFLASEAASKITGQAMAIDGHTETLAP